MAESPNKSAKSNDDKKIKLKKSSSLKNHENSESFNTDDFPSPTKERFKIQKDKMKENVRRAHSDRRCNKPMIVRLRNYNSQSQSSIPCLIGSSKVRRRHSGSLADTEFERQVVATPRDVPKSSSILGKSIGNCPIVDRKQGALQVFANRRTPSPNVLSEDLELKKKVDKALKARLYLLQQSGPNTFLIGGDSPDHKFRVTIGSQNCSCAKKQCLHILFVMLRVFQLKRNDQLLAASTLKNFEVESLFRSFHDRRTKRLDSQKKVNETKKSKIKDNNEQDNPELLSTDNSNQSNEEESCPICLSEILDGESLQNCNKCMNKYHHHCLSRWFAELLKSERRQMCPLCHENWDENSETSCLLESNNNNISTSPRQNRSPKLPHSTEPIAKELKDVFDRWKIYIGENLASCLLSTSWNYRETALRELSKIATRNVIRNKNDVNDIIVTPEHCTVDLQLLECCADILAYICGDPVYRVFVESLKSLRVILAHTSCQDEVQQVHLLNILKPVINSLLFKCADANRRTSQLSLSAILEFVKGQEGELSIGKYLENHVVDFKTDNLSYVVKCITLAEQQCEQFQWNLGRLFALEKLFEKYSSAFIIHGIVSNEEGLDRYPKFEKLKTCLEFLKRNFNHDHIKVSRVSMRLFCHICKAQSTYTRNWLFTFLDEVNLTVKETLRKQILNTKVYEMKPTNSANEIDSGIAFSTPEKQIKNPFEVFPFKSSPVSYDDDRPLTAPEQSGQRDCNLSKECEKNHDDREVFSPNFVTPSPNTMRNIKEADNETLTSDANLSGNYILSDLSNVSMKFHESFDKPLNINSEKTYERNILKIDHLSVEDDIENTNYSNGFDVSYNINDDNNRPESRLEYNGERNNVSSLRDIDESVSLLSSDSSNVESVSFMAELASSVTSPDSNSSDCKCKEEVRDEEDAALVEAIVRSEQTELPEIPGLCNMFDKETSVVDQADSCKQEYIENVHWTKGSQIGTGAFCTCFQAQDKLTGTLMACKQLFVGRNTKREEEERIVKVENEIKLIAKLNHRHIVRLIGATRQGLHFYLFAEWMSGGSVNYLLEKYGKFHENVVTRYLYQILLGLIYLHENRILHRDIKGANILVDSSGQQIRIADFGGSTSLKNNVTGIGEFNNQMLGTIAYTAPEVLRGENYGRSADIWSVGCVIIEMMTALPPWQEKQVDNQFGFLYCIANSSEAPIMPTFKSPGLKDVCLRCFELCSKDRPLAKDLIKHALFTMK